MTTPAFSDRTDFDNADRGFIAALQPAVITTADGRTVWDSDAYAFLSGDCPDTADANLWRQGQPCARQGLYEVTDGIYQVRGLDLSNMTIVEGDTGVIVIDPLISVETAQAAVDGGDLRFAAQLLQHAVFAAPDDNDAKDLLAQVYENLGHSTENGTWRNFYLTGAQELRHGVKATGIDVGSGMAAALSIEQIFDTVAIRVDAPHAWHETITIDWNFTDLGQSYRTTLRNGVLIHQQNPVSGDADLTLTLTKAQLLGMLAGKGLNGIAHEGDTDALKRLISVLDEPDPNFAIITP